MTTCNDIVRMAMSRLRQLRGGETPTGQEGEDGMIILQSLYDQWVSDGLFGRLNDTIISANYTAQEQDRVINDGGYTVTLPTTITPAVPSGSYSWPDERTWSYLYTTTPRPPRDLSMIEVVAASATVRKIYDHVRRTWVRLDSLALTDEAPLANRGSMGLASCLAEKWADDFGAQVGPSAAQDATTYRWGLSSRYDSQRVGNMATYF